MTRLKIHSPTITCIIATRNRRDIIDRAIQSVLDQTYPCSELLIIEDAGTDQTVEYLKGRYGHETIISVLGNQSRMGPAATRNRGLDLAQGEYVTFLDDDDQWSRMKIERQVALAVKGYDFVTMTRAKYVLNGRYVSHYGPELNTVTLRDLFRRNVILNVSPLIKTSLMRDIKFDPVMWCGEDYDAWIRLLNRGVKTINLNDPLVILHKDGETSLNQIRQNKFQGRMQIYAKHKSLMEPGEKLRFHLMTALKFAFPDPRYHINRMKQLIGDLR